MLRLITALNLSASTKDDTGQSRRFSLGFNDDFGECGAVVQAEHGYDWLSPLPINPKLESLQLYKGADSFLQLFTTGFCKCAVC